MLRPSMTGLPLSFLRRGVLLFLVLGSALLAQKPYPVTDFGAVAGGTALNTVAIQAAIDTAAQGGGVVVIPAGSSAAAPSS